MRSLLKWVAPVLAVVAVLVVLPGKSSAGPPYGWRGPGYFTAGYYPTYGYGGAYYGGYSSYRPYVPYRPYAYPVAVPYAYPVAVPSYYPAYAPAYYSSFSAYPAYSPYLSAFGYYGP